MPSNDCEPRVREVSDTNRPRNTHKTSNDRNGPLNTVKTTRFDLEGASSNVNLIEVLVFLMLTCGCDCTYDSYLQADNEEHNGDEEVVAEDAFEDVELVVQTPVVEDVEDLHPHETVENDGVQLKLHVGIRQIVAKNVTTGEVEDEDDGELVDVLPHDLLPHRSGDKRLILALRRAVQDLLRWWVCGECEGGESVHDQVDPEQLDCTKRRLHLLAVDSGNKGQDDSSDVDGNLKLSWVSIDVVKDEWMNQTYLKELLDSIIDSTTPHKGSDDRCEIVVHENDG